METKMKASSFQQGSNGIMGKIHLFLKKKKKVTLSFNPASLLGFLKGRQGVRIYHYFPLFLSQINEFSISIISFPVGKHDWYIIYL